MDPTVKSSSIQTRGVLNVRCLCFFVVIVLIKKLLVVLKTEILGCSITENCVFNFLVDSHLTAAFEEYGNDNSKKTKSTFLS